MAATPSSAPFPGFRVSLQVEIPSDVAYIELVVELVRHPCVELAFNPHQLALNVPVALTEALSNAILRANKESPDKRVRIRADVDAKKLVVEIADEGMLFDLEASTCDAAHGTNVEREDGRGLFLMRKLMDVVERFDADPSANPGNVVRLTLNRT
jgi:serine/threonine-protein kinase RsbW